MSEPGKPEKCETAETVDDTELDTAQGGGLMGSLIDGSGAEESGARSFQTLSNVMKNRTDTASDGSSFVTGAGGDPNV